MISKLFLVFFSTSSLGLPSPSINNNALGGFSGPPAPLLSQAVITQASTPSADNVACVCVQHSSCMDLNG